MTIFDAERTYWEPVEHREDRYAEQRLSIQRPGSRSSLRVTPELVQGLASTAHNDCRPSGNLFNAQSLTLLDPLAGRFCCT
jgi:hypothetical protein